INAANVLLNVALALLCLEAVYKLFERAQPRNQPQRHALFHWAAVLFPLWFYVWLTDQHWRVSTVWRRFGFAYAVSEEGLATLGWWVSATDVLMGVLFVLFLLYVTTTRRSPL